MYENNRNFILAILLSIGVLFAWQTFFLPQPEQAPGTKPADQQQQVELGPPQPQGEGAKPAGDVPQPGTQARAALTREEALAQSPRIEIDTPSLKGSIALKGGRIDDLILKDYRETVDPKSPKVVLLSPANSPHGYYAESGFVGGTDGDLGLPTADTLWTASSQGPLTPDSPVTLTYDGGKGLTFTRTISVDDKYMFTVDDQVKNSGTETVALYPYASVRRHECGSVLPPGSPSQLNFRASSSCTKV